MRNVCINGQLRATQRDKDLLKERQPSSSDEFPQSDADELDLDPLEVPVPPLGEWLSSGQTGQNSAEDPLRGRGHRDKRDGLKQRSSLDNNQSNPARS